MTWSDPIVEDVRRVRDAYAARFNYDLRAIFRDLKEQENRGGRTLVSYTKDAGSESKFALQPPAPVSTVSESPSAPEAVTSAER